MILEVRGKLVAGAVALLLVIAIAGMTAAGCGASANASGGVLKLTEADSGKTLDVKTGDTIEVVIAGNPTTGYEWTAALDPASSALLEQVGEPTYTPDSTDQMLVGSGGTYLFKFKAMKSGQATLKLVYARSFENVEPIQTFTATVNIK